jgi:hypothetical protein
MELKPRARSVPRGKENPGEGTRRGFHLNKLGHSCKYEFEPDSLVNRIGRECITPREKCGPDPLVIFTIACTYKLELNSLAISHKRRAIAKRTKWEKIHLDTLEQACTYELELKSLADRSKRGAITQRGVQGG